MTTAGWARGRVPFWDRSSREGLGPKWVWVRVGSWRGSDRQHQRGPRAPHGGQKVASKAWQRNLAFINRVPLQNLPRHLYKLLYSTYHTASSCAPRLRRPVRPRPRGRLRRPWRLKRRRRFGYKPPSPPPRGWCSEVVTRPQPGQQNHDSKQKLLALYKKKQVVSPCALWDTKATGPIRIPGAGSPPCLLPPFCNGHYY
jgi:hypothetical protein